MDTWEVALKGEAELQLAHDIKNIWGQYVPYVVTDNEIYEVLAKHRQTLKEHTKRLETARKERTQPIDKFKKGVLAMFKEYETILETANEAIDKSMLAWQRKLELDRAEEQRKINEHIAEQERAAKAKLEAAALKEVVKGNDDKAEKLIERAEDLRFAVPQLAPVKAKAEGTGVRTYWKFRITDASLVPPDFLVPDETKIRKYGEMMKEQAAMPGVEFFSEQSLMSR